MLIEKNDTILSMKHNMQITTVTTQICSFSPFSDVRFMKSIVIKRNMILKIYVCLNGRLTGVPLYVSEYV